MVEQSPKISALRIKHAGIWKLICQVRDGEIWGVWALEAHGHRKCKAASHCRLVLHHGQPMPAMDKTHVKDQHARSILCQGGTEGSSRDRNLSTQGKLSRGLQHPRDAKMYKYPILLVARATSSSHSTDVQG